MNWNDIRLRVRAIVFRARVENELTEELHDHLELQARKYQQAGMTAEGANRQSRIDVGGLEQYKEACRDSRRITFLTNLAQDLKYALRGLQRGPGFTAIVVLILAIGIGANVATFSVLDAFLLRMLPVKDPASLFRAVGATANTNSSDRAISYRMYNQVRDRSRRFADLMAYQSADGASVAIDNSVEERLIHQTVSGNYFSVLGVEPVLGRAISVQDDEAGSSHSVAVISYGLWKRKFNRSEDVLGHNVRIGDRSLHIVGVAPPRFFGVEIGKMVDIWTPVALAPRDYLANDHIFWLHVMGRLKSGATVAQAVAPLQATFYDFMVNDVRQHAPPGTPKAIITRFLAGTRLKGAPAGGGISYLRQQYRQPLQIMMGVVALVLLIACSNVASLLIARGASRQREIAVRLSVGAGRTRVMQQLMTEGLLLALISGVVGLLFAHWAVPLLTTLLAPQGAPLRLSTGVDVRLLSFTTAITFLTVLVFGTFPAMRLSRADAYPALNSRVHLLPGGRGRARQILVSSQIALSLVLVIAAVLFTRTLLTLLSSYLGFQPNHVLVARLSFQPSQPLEHVIPAWTELLQRVRELPGVVSASLASQSLFSGSVGLMGIRAQDTASGPADPTTGQLWVSTGYFQTLEIRFLGGRDFNSHDLNSSSPSVAIVNEALVRKFFHGENPIGRKLTKMANAPVWTEVIGVVADVKSSNLRDPAPPLLYVPYERIAEWITPQAHPEVSMSIQALGVQTIASLSTELRRLAGHQFSVERISTQTQLIDDTLVRERLLANVASVFAVLALGLAAFGLYGVMSYAVVQRRQEIGIRMAVGAARTNILALILRDSSWILLSGTLAGVAIALAITRLFRTLLFGLASNDLETFFIASILVLAVAFVAALVPAYRATETDPMIALRYE